MRKFFLFLAMLLTLSIPAWCQNPFTVTVTASGGVAVTTNIAAATVTVQQTSGTAVNYTVFDACLSSGHTTIGAGAPYTFTGATCGSGYANSTTVGTLQLSSGPSVTFTVTEQPVGSSGGTPGDTTAKYIIGGADATLTNAKSWPSLYNSPDMPPSSPTVYDDEFDANNISPSGTAQWSWVNQGSSTATFTSGWVDIAQPSNSSSISAGLLVESTPSPTWAFTTKFTTSAQGIPYAGTYSSALFGMRESSTGKLLLVYTSWEPATSDNRGYFATNIVAWTSTAGANQAIRVAAFPIPNQPMYWRVKDDGTNCSFWYSAAGTVFYQVFSETCTTDFTTAPNQVFIGVDGYNVNSVASFEWIRRTQ